MKIGLVLEGGSRKCMFTAGVIDALLDQNIKFSYVTGVSGGAQAALNYISEQRGRLRNLLYPSAIRKGRKPHKYLDGVLKEFRIMTSEYFFDHYSPYNFKKLFSSDIDWEIGLTCAETGTIQFMSERSDKQRLQSIVEGTCALPMCFPLVEFDGKHYADGCITDSIPFDRAFEKGCDKVFVISTKVPGDKATDFGKYRLILSYLYEKKFPAYFKILMNRYKNYVQQFKQMEALEKQGKILVFKPEIELCALFDTNKAKLDESYNHGYTYALKRLDELKTFISEAPSNGI